MIDIEREMAIENCWTRKKTKLNSVDAHIVTTTANFHLAISWIYLLFFVFFFPIYLKENSMIHLFQKYLIDSFWICVMMIIKGTEEKTKAACILNSEKKKICKEHGEKKAEGSEIINILFNSIWILVIIIIIFDSHWTKLFEFLLKIIDDLHFFLLTNITTKLSYFG